MIRIRYGVTLVLYIVSCSLYLYDSSSLFLILLGVSILLFSMPLSKKDFPYALSLLPFAFILGPVFLIPIGSLSIHIADTLLFIDFILFVLFFKNEIRLKITLLNFSIVILLLLCSVLSISIMSSIVTLILILQWLIYYWMCNHCFSTEESFYGVLNKWAHAVTLASLLVILSFFIGKPLILNPENELSKFSDMRVGANVFLRASYFVTSFIYVNACILVTWFLKLIRDIKGKSFFELITNLTIFSINLFCALLMQNKTELFSVFFIFLVITLFSFHNRLYIKRILIFITCLVVVSFSSYNLIVDALGEEQLMLFLERVNENGSYNARIPIWNNVLQYIYINPKVLLIGIGPDMSIRLSDAHFFDKLFSNQGIREYAVDSNYLTFLLNYGLILTLFFVSRIIAVLGISFKKNYTQFTKNYLVYPILVWLIMGFTQLHGISKPGFLLIFYMAIGFKFLNIKKIENLS
jgi:hypothetical protein